MTTHTLTIDEIVALCAEYNIRSRIPFSQLEAEAVHRRIDVLQVLRVHLIERLHTIGVLGKSDTEFPQVDHRSHF